MQCEAPQAPLADANQRSGNDAMRPPFAFPQGWAEMRRLLWRAACEGAPPFAAPPFAHPSAFAAQRISRSWREQALTMAQLFAVHPVNPQVRLLRQAAQILDHGGVGAIPTDSCYALACHLDDKAAVDRIRTIRRMDDRHLMTLMCRDLSDLASYAKVDNGTYRLLRDVTPGPYTLILDATREVPRRLSHPSRRTIGLRIPDHPAALGLLDVLGQPLISTTLQLPGDELPLNDVDDIRARLDYAIDFVLDAGPCGVEPTTVVDLTGARAIVVRAGKGDPAALGL
jgi:tRNA threonylcarbamoyl adenosine modification protein (Sua5/YciO/YrdC/YwlC family)